MLKVCSYVLVSRLKYFFFHRKFILIIVALAVMVAVALAAPQQQQLKEPKQPQQQRPQQQQRRRPQEGTLAGRKKQKRPGANKNEVEVFIGADGKPIHLDHDVTLSKVSQKDLDHFLSKKEAVNEMVLCFEDIRRCRSRAGASLVRK